MHMPVGVVQDSLWAICFEESHLVCVFCTSFALELGRSLAEKGMQSLYEATSQRL